MKETIKELKRLSKVVAGLRKYTDRMAVDQAMEANGYNECVDDVVSGIDKRIKALEKKEKDSQGNAYDTY